MGCHVDARGQWRRRLLGALEFRRIDRFDTGVGQHGGQRFGALLPCLGQRRIFGRRRAFFGVAGENNRDLADMPERKAREQR